MDPLVTAALDRARNALDVARATPPDDARRTLHIEPGHQPSMLGLSKRELRQYSLRQAICDLAEARRHTFATEVSDELARLHVSPNPGNGNQLLIPPDIIADILGESAQRDLTVASAQGGGFLRGTQTGSFIDLARNRSVTGSLGATLLPDLRGDLVLPRQSASATGYVLSLESSTVTESQPTLGSIALTPKIIGAYCEYSRLLLRQSSPAVEQFLANDLLRVVGTAIDLAALNGSGTAGQPTGILNTTGIGTVSGTSIALAGVLEFETDVGNSLSPTCGFVTTSAIASTLAQRPVLASGTSERLWMGSLYDGVMAGYRAMSSAQIPASTLLFGAFDQLLLGSWGVLAIEINPYTGFTAGIIGARVLHAFDCAVLMPGAFSVATSVT